MSYANKSKNQRERERETERKKKSVYLGEFLRGWFIESFWSSEDLVRERGGGFVKGGGANAAMSRTRRWKQ